MVGKAAQSVKKKRGPKPGPKPLIDATARIYFKWNEHEAAATFEYIIATYGTIQDYIRQHDPRRVVEPRDDQKMDLSEECDGDEIDLSLFGV